MNCLAPGVYSWAEPTPPRAVDTEIANSQQPGHLELPEWTKPPERGRVSEARPGSCRSVGVNSSDQPPPAPLALALRVTPSGCHACGLAAGVGGAGCGPDSPTATRRAVCTLPLRRPRGTTGHQGERRAKPSPGPSLAPGPLRPAPSFLSGSSEHRHPGSCSGQGWRSPAPSV